MSSPKPSIKATGRAASDLDTPVSRPAKLVTFVVLCLVIVWAVADVIRSYPAKFYPRFWDEAIYAVDVTTPGVLAGRYNGYMHYAASKPGYGWPLAGAVALFGDQGAMYFSTAMWFATISLIGLAVLRRFGVVAGVFAAAFLSYSPFFGKYVAEAGPTTMAAFFFVLLWILYEKRRFWATGLVIGCLALIDFKWIPPIAVAVVTAELLLERQRPWRQRFAHVGGAALVACAVPALLVLVHRPFFDYLWHYVFDHSRGFAFQPSLIFGYYLARFGAGLAILAALIACAARPIRARLSGLGEARIKSLLYASIFSLVPIMFYSLLGGLKVLRFFAVPFPLLAIPTAVAVGQLFALGEEKAQGLRHLGGWAATSALAALMAALILVGSDGPARHLRIQSCFPTALEKLSTIATREGAVSSYIWPVVYYGWQFPVKAYPFTMWGPRPTDKWLASDRILDRVTVENRLYGDQGIQMTPDSFLIAQRTTLRPYLDSLFSVPSDFFASDYFLSEQTVEGIPVLRRWQEYRRSGRNYVTIYHIDQAKLWK